MHGYQLALGFHGLERLEGGQKGIEGFFSTGTAVKPSLKRDRSSSTGPSTKISIPTSGLAPKRAFVSNEVIELDDDDDIAIQVEAAVQASQPPRKKGKGIEYTEAEQALTWTCPKCNQVLKLIPPEPSKQNEDSMDTQMTAMKQEHADYHFARELHMEDRPVQPPAIKPNIGGGPSRPRPKVGPAGSETNSKPKKKEIKKPAGIKAFFTPRQ